MLQDLIVTHYTWEVNCHMRYEGYAPKYIIRFVLLIKRMVAMVAHQLSLHSAAQRTRLINGRRCPSGNVNCLACDRLTTHAVSWDVCQTRVLTVHRILSHCCFLSSILSGFLCCCHSCRYGHGLFGLNQIVLGNIRLKFSHCVSL